VTLAIVHPGQMGAALGAAFTASGQEVWWCSQARSSATRERAEAAGLRDAGSLDALVQRSDFILSVCPPHGALQLATQVAEAAGSRTGWHYVDANAISPDHAGVVGSRIEKAGGIYTDGGIIGPPPTRSGLTRLYLSGPVALEASERLATPLVELHVIDDRVGSASALKLAYAAWTKGSAALLLAARAAAARTGVETALVEEWRTSQPGLIDRWDSARNSAHEKGWRWVGEMREIASMFEATGLPAGFHAAAAQVYEDPTTLA
jgi:3-hydroxyisobutyrate dehydrogenase-like beta-hydroxyacid dehydrogenase